MRQKQKSPKPPHPGEMLEEFYIKQLSLNLDELANNLGISRNTLYKIRKGRTQITPEIAVRLSQAFSTSIEFWLNLQQKYDLWIIFNNVALPKVPTIYSPQAHKSRLPHRTHI